MTPRSPLAPVRFPALPAIDGLGLAVAASGMKYKNRDDILLMTLCKTFLPSLIPPLRQLSGAAMCWFLLRLVLF